MNKGVPTQSLFNVLPVISASQAKPKSATLKTLLLTKALAGFISLCI